MKGFNEEDLFPKKHFKKQLIKKTRKKENKKLKDLTLGLSLENLDNLDLDPDDVDSWDV